MAKTASISLSFGPGLTVTKQFDPAIGADIINGHIEFLRESARLQGLVETATDQEKLAWFLDHILEVPIRNSIQWSAGQKAREAQAAEETRLKDRKFG